MNSEPDIKAIAHRLLCYLKREWKLPFIQFMNPPTPILGGFETSIFRFRLQDAPASVSDTLILRLFKRYASPGTALRETIVQNAVADTGIPAPRVFLTCTDSSIIGGEFNIMEFLTGRPMIETQRDDHPELLARTHIRLHEVNPSPIIKVLMTHGFKKERFSLQGQLNWVNQRINEAHYDWLKPGLFWLCHNKPAIKELAICHGDFHPLNILMTDGEISGVLDWSGFRIADPTLDVAATKVIGLILAPVLVPGAISSEYIERYLAAYQMKFPLNNEKLMYYEVLRLILGLINGADGQAAWRHKDVVIQTVHTLCEYIGLTINIPHNMHLS